MRYVYSYCDTVWIREKHQYIQYSLFSNGWGVEIVSRSISELDAKRPLYGLCFRWCTKLYGYGKSFDKPGSYS